MLKEITTQEYLEKIRAEKEPYLLVFHALWCGPCRMFKDSLEEISEKDDVKVYRVDVDQNKDLVSQFAVSSMPTWFIFKDGHQIHKQMGFLPYEKLKEVFDSNTK